MNLIDQALVPTIASRAEEVLGIKPWDFQIKTAESVCDQQDTIAIAPTGSGKSVSFKLPFLACTNPDTAMVIIITPLKALQVDQTWS
jgi:ATP-dependent helicase YprA (DUF1998 family)